MMHTIPPPSTALTAAQLHGNHRERLLGIDAVMHLTDLSRSAIYGRMAAGKFPCAVHVHGRRVAWKETEINNWIENRPRLPNAKDTT